MAESIVSIFLEKLNHLVEYHAGLFTGAEKEISYLKIKLEWIRSFLKDADGRSKENALVRTWVSQVRDVAFVAEDIIDDFIIHKQKQQQKTVMGISRRIFRPVTQPISLYRFSRQIMEIKGSIEEISRNQAEYGLVNFQGGSTSSLTESQYQFRNQTTAMEYYFDMEEQDVVGIEDDVRSIIGRLATEGKRRTVVSIVGMGGLGKTTLAKKVYNNVKEDFDFHAWITVSNEYNVRAIIQHLICTSTVLSKAEMERVEKMGMEELRHKLAVYLHEKRYLIVVDDVWSREAWDAFLPAFPNGMKGSRIMLTTRNKDIALYADAVSVPHEPKLLPQDKCWELFCKKAFPGSTTGGVRCPHELERLGKQIVAKCDGLPLAVIVLGGMLSRKEKLPSEWEKVYKSISWQLREGEDRISGILGLSYNDLPYYLKSCFLYCGVFPEDSKFSARKLIKFWIAEGFIQSRGAETMEEVGEDYLRELIYRSMIQVAGKSYDGRLKTCRIHDLLRDLAISEAKEGKLYLIFAQDESLLYSTGMRRLVVYHGGNELSLSKSHLRTLLNFTGRDLSGRNLENLFSEARFLTVFDVEGVRGLSHLPGQIGNLIHLRHLGLRNTGLEDLPDSVGNLFNLLTLDIRGTECVSLPKGLLKNQAFRHLSLGRCFLDGLFSLVCQTISFPKHEKLGNMRNLVTLKGIEAGGWIVDSLEMLTNLCHLGIGRISSAHVESVGKTIPKLDHLRSLWLQGEAIPTLNLSRHHLLYKMYLGGRLEKLPNSWEFPANLTKLLLQDSGLIQDPFPVLMELRKLKILGLLWGSYTGTKMHCRKGGFPELQQLVIRLIDLEEWEVDIGAMPRLKSTRVYWNTESSPDDGFTWRKYGQKEILGSTFRRNYFRCTLRDQYQCPAKKQVQRLENDPFAFVVTYHGNHICHMSSTAPPVLHHPPPLRSPPPPSLHRHHTAPGSTQMALNGYPAQPMSMHSDLLQRSSPTLSAANGGDDATSSTFEMNSQDYLGKPKRRRFG